MRCADAPPVPVSTDARPRSEAHATEVHALCTPAFDASTRGIIRDAACLDGATMTARIKAA